MLNIPLKSEMFKRQGKESKTDPAAGTLPSFPAFNDDWPANVRVEWLRSYVELVKILPKEK